MKVAVVGAEGMLGTEIVEKFHSNDIEVYDFNRQDLDITDFSLGQDKLQEIAPDVIINCAAYTDVDGAEKEREKALGVNALGPRNLSLIAKKIGATLVHYSTDFIFDGTKQEPYHIFDQASPVNYYGFSKYMGEQLIFTLSPKYIIIRTSWLFGANGNNFVDSIMKAAKDREYLTVVEDQVGSPTYAKDLASASLKLIEASFFGVYHVTNKGWTSWFNFAQRICEYAGIDIEIKPIKTEELHRPAKRPFNSRLDSFPLEETIGETLPPWEDALGRYLEK